MDVWRDVLAGHHHLTEDYRFILAHTDRISRSTLRIPCLSMSTDCLPVSDSMSASGVLRISPTDAEPHALLSALVEVILTAPQPGRLPLGPDHVRRRCAGPEEIAVARYYFDIQDGAQSLRDDDGSEFDSLDAAVQAATRSAAEIGTGRLSRGDTSAVVIECGMSAASESAPSKHRWRTNGTSHGHRVRNRGAQRCKWPFMPKKNPAPGRALSQRRS
jgi:hypothetical protein